jgi:hypothetical protein
VKNFALRDVFKKFGGFSHGLGRIRLSIQPMGWHDFGPNSPRPVILAHPLPKLFSFGAGTDWRLARWALSCEYALTRTADPRAL